MINSAIVQIAEGLGNQLFMYAHAFSLAKKINKTLLIDNTSGFFQKKNKLRGQKYLLDCFNINNTLAPSKYKYDNHYKYILKKILICLDVFSKNQSFLLEKTYKFKHFKEAITYQNYDKINFSNNFYIQGNFENEKYFQNYRDDLINIITVKNNFININKDLINKISNTNSVSIHIRKHRFSDQNIKKYDSINKTKSDEFTQKTLNYIDRGIAFFNSKFDNLNFFVWSNDFTDLDNFFSKYKSNNFYFIKGNNTINDFNLFQYSKHFIVSPSSYHWWGAWLNKNNNKICLCPKNINPSNNKGFWPDEWIKI
jgi:hypothetical protein